MSLNKADLRKVRRWLTSKIDNQVCQACGAESYTIGDLLFLPHVKDAELGEPVVAIMCDVCAHVAFFDAVKMGLYQR